jgi:hypothetical protein
MSLYYSTRIKILFSSKKDQCFIKHISFHSLFVYHLIVSYAKNRFFVRFVVILLKHIITLSIYINQSNYSQQIMFFIREHVQISEQKSPSFLFADSKLTFDLKLVTN